MANFSILSSETIKRIVFEYNDRMYGYYSEESTENMLNNPPFFTDYQTYEDINSSNNPELFEELLKLSKDKKF